jgi:hypothetical protein
MLTDQVDEEDQDRDRDHKAGDGDDQVHWLDAQGRIVVDDAAAHAQQAGPHLPRLITIKDGNISQKCHLAQRLVHPAAGRFGEPVIEGREEGEDVAAKHGAVEVPDHEVGIVQVQVAGDDAQRRPGEAAGQEDDSAPRQTAWAYQSAAYRPIQMVAVQLNTLTPVGTATSSVLYMNGTRRYSSMPAVNI